MTLAVDVLLFLLGVYLSIRAVAACYRVPDLWYAVRTAYPLMLRGILGSGAVIVAIGVLLRDQHRGAFLSGLLAFLLFYLSLFPLRHLVLRRRR